MLEGNLFRRKLGAGLIFHRIVIGTAANIAAPYC
jgi:hypothetical protein